MARLRGLGAVAITAWLLTSCGSVIDKRFNPNGGREFDFRNPECAPREVGDTDAVELRYLGSGGWSVRWRNDVVLLGPFFSNPGMIRARFGRLQHDATRINKGMRGLPEESIHAILAGHSHYDHIGDIPDIARRYAPRATIYTNDSGRNMLQAYADIRDHVVSIEEERLDWIRIRRQDGSDSSIRIRAVLSAHAPQVCRCSGPICRYAECDTDEPWTTEWTGQRLSRLCGGQTYAFVIDLLDGETVCYRIYYNDSAAGAGNGYPPDALKDHHVYDLAILCMASFDLVDGYPAAILKTLEPRHVLVSHYENFFRKDDGAWMFAPLLTNGKADTFMTIVKKEMDKRTPHPPVNPICGVTAPGWTMPVPSSTLLFMPDEENQP